MKIPKSAQKFMDAEIADDRRRQKAKEKAFGKPTLAYIHSVQHACLDLLHFGFKDTTKVRSITVTVAVELKNGAKLGHVACSMPNMPDRVKDLIAAAGKKKMKKILKKEALML